MHIRTNILLRLVPLAVVVMIAAGGCTSQYGLLAPQSRTGGSDGLLVRTYDEHQLFFHDRQWKLTVNGIAGRAEVTTAEGMQYVADTTLSYWNTESAEATGRNNTMGRFMLTVLGIILVLGLAGIILYAAFLATDR